MPPKSLRELALSAALKNVKSIRSVGYLSYQSVRDLLLKVESAVQLHCIELHCPQLQGQTGEVWLKLIEKDFPLELRAKGYKPNTEDQWHKVWERYKRESDQSLQESEEKLRGALDGLREHKEKNTSTIVEGRFLRSDVVRPRKRETAANNSISVFRAASRGKMRSGADVLKRARREARVVSNMRNFVHCQRDATTTFNASMHDKKYVRMGPRSLVAHQDSVSPPPQPVPQPLRKSEEREQQQEPQELPLPSLEVHAQRSTYNSGVEDSDAEEFARICKQRAENAPPKKYLRSGRNLFQSKFGPANRSPSTQKGPASKKRTSSSANLDEPSAPLKRKQTESHERPVTPTKPLSSASSSPEAIAESPAASSSPKSETSPAPKVIIRKKKPVNIFMKPRARR